MSHFIVSDCSDKTGRYSGTMVVLVIGSSNEKASGIAMVVGDEDACEVTMSNDTIALVVA